MTTMRRIGMILAACAVAGCEPGDADAGARGSSDAPAADSGAGVGGAAKDSAAYAFRLHEAEPGVADSIVVTRGGRPIQTLVPSERTPVPGTEAERISRIDVNFDGHADLGLVTLAGAANTRSDYWRLDPRTGRFVFAGNHQTFRPDSAARELTAFNRGGHGGRVWSASRWRWMEGALAEVRREEQEWSEDAQRYVLTVREWRDGGLAVVSRDTLDESALRSGPTWERP